MMKNAIDLIISQYNDWVMSTQIRYSNIYTQNNSANLFIQLSFTNAILNGFRLAALSS